MDGSASARQRSNNDWLVGQRVGRYEVLLRLAAGGMGAVYVGRAVGLGGFERLVAIKILHPHLADEEEFITMLLDEARLAARVRHPNVVPTLDVAQWQDLHYLVMEYVEGDHLAGLMKEGALAGKGIPRRATVRILMDALAGLGAAHDLTDDRGNPLNIVHRDVSPQNILIGSDGIARLTDFGVAKAEYRLSSTRQGTFKGKLAYTAPETASTAHAEQRSDLFAMGVVLWEALTTQRLFRAESNIATLKMLLEDPIPLPSSVDPALAPYDAVCAKALARPLDERFQSAHEFMEALERAAQAADGVGAIREVGEVVRSFAAKKLEQERAGIRDAIERMHETPARAYEGGQPKDELTLDVAVVDSQPPTTYGKGSEAKPKRAMLVGLAVLLFVLAAVGAAVAFGGGDEEETPLDPSADGATTAPSEAPAGPEAAPETNDSASAMAAETRDESGASAGMDATEGSVTGVDDGAQVEDAHNDDALGEEETGASTTSATAMSGMQRGTRPSMRGSMRGGGGDDDDVLSNPYRQD